MGKCSVCGSNACFLAAGTDAELAHVALQLGCTLKEVQGMRTCAECGTRWVGKKILPDLDLYPYPGKSLLDVYREILRREDE